MGAGRRTLGEDTELSSDVTVTNNTERLTPDLPAALGDLVPDTLPHLSRSVGELARQADDLGHDELGDGPRVREGRVEDGDTGRSGGLEVDLICSDAEATDGEELRNEGGEVSSAQSRQNSASPPLENSRRTLVAALMTFSVILVLLRIPMAWNSPILLRSSSSDQALAWCSTW